MKTNLMTPRLRAKTCALHATRVLIASAVFAIYIMSGSASAALIGVNFSSGSSTTNLTPAEFAGVAAFAQSNYNNVSSAPTNLILNNDSGTATTATLTTSGTINFAQVLNPSGPDEKLNSGSANTIDGTSHWSFTLNQIPYASYSLIVYDLDHLGTEKGITIGGTTFYSSSPDLAGPGGIDNNASTPFNYRQATSTDFSTPTPNSDYVLFTGLTGTTQTVGIAYRSGFASERVGGFQIVEVVPEPGSASLLILGGLALLARRRRS